MAPALPPVAAPPQELATPIVTLNVRAPKDAQPGKDVEYHLIVENPSRAPAHHVRVLDRLPAGARFVRSTPPAQRDNPESRDYTWELGTLPPAEHREIVLVITPPADSEFENQAFVRFEHGLKVKTRLARPDLHLRVQAPPKAGIHEAVTYFLEVSNGGKAEAHDVVVRVDGTPGDLSIADSKVDGQTDRSNRDLPREWKLGSVQPGQTRKLEFSGACLKIGKMRNRAELTAAGGVRQQAEAAVEVVAPHVGVEVLGPRWHPVGTPATYTIVVSNTGAVTANEVQVTNSVPPEVTLVSSPKGSVEGSRVRWLLDRVPGGGKQSVQFTVRVDHVGKFRNVVRVAAVEGNEEAGSTITQFIDPAKPGVDIEPETSKWEVGRNTACRFRICNPSQTVMRSVCLSITLPDGLQLLDVRGPSRYRLDGIIVHCDPLTQLLPGQEVIYTVDARAERPGNFPLQADVTTTVTTVSGHWEETVAVLPASPRGPSAGK
jgi:uncharacterized repeat protein (TIGR01451 family)